MLLNQLSKNDSVSEMFYILITGQILKTKQTLERLDFKRLDIRHVASFTQV